MAWQSCLDRPAYDPACLGCDDSGEVMTIAQARPKGTSGEGLLEDVRRAMEQDRDAAREAAARLVTFLALPDEADSTAQRGGMAPWQRRKVERYLRDNLERPVRLEELAAQVCLSVSHFCRVFKESVGTTPHMHLVRLRIALAQRLMLTTDDPLSQIALACGLADQAHLSKLFRREVGETPSAWRRRQRTGDEGFANSGRLERRNAIPIALQSYQ